MKSRIMNDPINQFIAANWDIMPKQLSKLIEEKFEETIQRNNISKRKQRILEKFGSIENLTTFAEELESGGFNPHNWRHGWLKTEKTSIFIKNKDDIVSYEDIKEEFLKTIKKHAPRYTKIRRTTVRDGHLLVIDPADIHIGKLAMKEESGADYNIDIAVDRCVKGVEGVVNKSQGFDIAKIIFVIGNDILHTDNAIRTTTAGTKQDTDKQWWYAYINARAMYVKIIERLITVANVHVVFCPSNHDYVSGFMLADSIACWFNKCSQVTFDVSMRHRKYNMYGNTMLEFDHGDGHKDADTPLIMASEQPELWAKSKFRYSFKHHKHHHMKIKWQSGKDYHGTTMIYLRTPSGTDRWHDNNGYMAVPKAVEGFVVSKANGLVSSITHYF